MAKCGPTVCLLAATALLSVGCLQIETKIALHPDGSATITERVRFSQKVMDLSATGAKGLAMAPLLEKPAVLERMKHMGEGIRLASHKVSDIPGGARESVAVFEIGDIRQFRYASPFLAFRDYPQAPLLQFGMFPVYETTWYGRLAGQMAVTVTPIRKGREPRKPEEEPPAPAPSKMQILRDLQPVFRDMMDGFHVKVTFESYAPLRFRQYYRYREMRARTRRFDLIDFSSRNQDQFSVGFLGNEEIMLELAQTEFGKSNVVENVKDHANNPTLPVYHPRGVPEIYFNPSKHMFNAHFKGKTLKFTERQGGPRVVNFDEIGWRGEKARNSNPGATTRPDGGAR